MLAVFQWMTGVLGGHALVGAIVLGGFAGWMLVTLMGYLVQTVVAGVILLLIFLLGYLPLAFFFSWPPFS